MTKVHFSPKRGIPPLRERTVAAENLYALSKGSAESFSYPSASKPRGRTPLKSARSVALPPIAPFPSGEGTMAVLKRAERQRSSFTALLHSRTSPHTCPPPSTNFTASSSPFVRVPVLSVNKIFSPPDASMPTGLRTITLSFSIRSILEESTTAIIMGSPSGTATTTMAMASVSACISRGTHTVQVQTSAHARERLMPLSMRKLLNKSATAMSTAARYPSLLSVPASPANLTRRGLSGGSSCISPASPP